MGKEAAIQVSLKLQVAFDCLDTNRSSCVTAGSRGTFDAAVAGVAAAIKAVDWVVGGKCVNAFCATRPPGHHAGRSLHPMGAESNGFCILNPVACAAIFATTPPTEGGLGLKRAAVIDFDVHHGNGTQDILCSTYDPRFLYVSIHAGGAQINGNDTDASDDEDDGDLPKVGKGKKLNGIFPGRSGDTSPHKGVLNIPLGQRVTPHEVGNALFTLIEPAIEAFSPDIMFLSAGFDGHKNDPLGMGGLSAHDFGHLTDVACAMALRFCSGRIVSVLEGGYGVPCCRPQKNSFLPHLLESSKSMEETTSDANINGVTTTRPSIAKRMRSLKIYDLGDSLPENMDDQVTPALQRRLEKCHSEGFVDCIREHVASLHRNKVNA
jgi:acetoin utilization deacetylase AcuC-like enzyme